MATTFALPNLTSSIGVGTNTVPNQEQNKVYEQFKGGTIGAVGKAIDAVGKATGNILPDFKISENLERIGGMLNPSPAYAAEPSGGDLVSALTSKGYSYQDAVNAANGPDASRLRSEYLGSGGGSTGSGNRSVNVSRVASEKGLDVAQDYSNYADQMSPEQYYAMIDQEAGNTMNFLNQQEQAIRADQPGIEQGINAQADLLRNKALSTREDAQSAARRLYSELQQGYRQRFGGASSAGEAAMALTNNEQQRQMAQNNRTYQESVAQVDLSANQAVQSAQSEFRNQLLAINQNRVATENERLAARRQALSDLSNKVFQIQQQRDAFKQNLAMMQEQARLQNEQNLSSLRSNPTSTLGQTQAPVTASGNQGITNAVGYVNPSGVSRGINLDEYMRNNVNPYAR